LTGDQRHFVHQYNPEDLAALKEDAKYWIEHMPKVSTVNAALEYDWARVFDLLFDRGMVFEDAESAIKWTAACSRTTAHTRRSRPVSAKCINNV
jgi:formate C-acetyltransferase